MKKGQKAKRQLTNKEVTTILKEKIPLDDKKEMDSINLKYQKLFNYHEPLANEKKKVCTINKKEHLEPLADRFLKQNGFNDRISVNELYKTIYSNLDLFKYIIVTMQKDPDAIQIIKSVTDKQPANIRIVSRLDPASSPDQVSPPSPPASSETPTSPKPSSPPKPSSSSNPSSPSEPSSPIQPPAPSTPKSPQHPASPSPSTPQSEPKSTSDKSPSPDQAPPPPEKSTSWFRSLYTVPMNYISSFFGKNDKNKEEENKNDKKEESKNDKKSAEDDIDELLVDEDGNVIYGDDFTYIFYN